MDLCLRAFIQKMAFTLELAAESVYDWAVFQKWTEIKRCVGVLDSSGLL